MHLERLKSISVYYWMKDLFASTPIIKVVDSFPDEALEIPSVSVEWRRMSNDTFEMGNRKGNYYRMWEINIFAKNASQRDEMFYKIIEALENPIPVYDYNEGFPPDVSPTKLGVLLPDTIDGDIIRVMSELSEKLYYRAKISFYALYNSI